MLDPNGQEWDLDADYTDEGSFDIAAGGAAVHVIPERCGGAFDCGDGVAQRKEAVASAGVGGIDSGELQQRGRVASVGGDERVESHQRRSRDKVHVHDGQEVVQ